jgi:hypothetical protein
MSTPSDRYPPVTDADIMRAIPLEPTRAALEAAKSYLAASTKGGRRMLYPDMLRHLTPTAAGPGNSASEASTDSP